MMPRRNMTAAVPGRWVSFFLGCMVAAHAASAELVGHWPLDGRGDPAIATDVSGRGNHGAVAGVGHVPDGRGGTAARFDGSGGYVSLPAAAFSAIDTGYTITFLAKGGATQPRSSFVFQAWDPKGTRSIGCSLPWSNGALVYDYGLDCGHRVMQALGSGQIKGEWNLWAFTRDAATGEAAVYCNGRLVVEGNDTAAVPAFGAFYIGAFDEDGLYPHDGLVKDFRLYNHILDAAEIEEVSFRSLGYAPREARPADGARDVGISRALRWHGPPKVELYRIHLGKTEHPSPVAEQRDTAYLPAALEYDTTYYWRVDSLAGGTVTPGETWSFRTTAPPPDPDVLGFDEVVFVKRKPYSSDHNYTVVNNGTSPDRFLAENGIYVYSLRTARVRPIVTAADLPGGTGVIGKFSLSFDAKKAIFDYRQDPESGFRIWEVNIDGSGLRQLTFPPEDEAEKLARYGPAGFHTDDMHPCYLPDGGIAFTSSRCEHAILCGGQPGLVSVVLHRMDADGGNMEQLSSSPVSEFSPVVLEDGRIMYHRWEYIDKGARVGKTFWAMNPDGSKSEELFGVSDSFDATGAFSYGQPVPGGRPRIVCSVGPHFPQGNSVGPIKLIDLTKDNRTSAPLTNITPEVEVDSSQGGWRFAESAFGVPNGDGVGGRLYGHPFPVNERQFLVAHKADPAAHYAADGAYAIYLIDTQGGKALVYEDEDATVSCWHPTPLLAREVPGIIHAPRSPELRDAGLALCIVQNIHEGMQDVEPGSVKFIRINEAVPQYWAAKRMWDPSYHSASWPAALWPRVQWGIVPVEQDGSAAFTVPADRNIFFQALDDNYMEVQRERTYVNYKPGETRSCIGCHERAGEAPKPAGGATPMALRRAPSAPAPQPGEDDPRQVIHYPAHVQPIWDSNCMPCHDAENRAGDLNLSGQITTLHSVSYEELLHKELAGPVIAEFMHHDGHDEANANGSYLPPKSLGAHRSGLVSVLRTRDRDDPHFQILGQRDLLKVIRWVDSNYQFYGTYYGRRHGAHQALADFRRAPSFEEAISPMAPEWHR